MGNLKNFKCEKRMALVFPDQTMEIHLLLLPTFIPITSVINSQLSSFINLVPFA